MSKFLRRLSHFLLLSFVVFVLVLKIHSYNYHARSQTQTPQNCHIVQHTMGETCVPNVPQRIVTTFHTTLGNVLYLGTKPVGATAFSAEMPFPPYLRQKAEGVELIGSQTAPNLEKILMLKPDLILVHENLKAFYPLLSKISPTVVVPWYGQFAWREHIESVTKVLRKEKESEQAWNNYYRKINALKAVLQNQYQGQTISIFSPSIDWGFFILAKNSFSGSIVNDLELQRPTIQNIDTPSGYIVFNSEENLDMLDGDIIFVLSKDGKERRAFEELIQKPLWKKLKAVQQGHVYCVDSSAWFGSNFLAADVVLDDLYRYLSNLP